MSCSCTEEQVCPSCEDTGISPVYCADPEVCEEIFPATCVEYTGDEDIKCGEEAYELFPDVNHVIVDADGTPTERRLPAILENINEQLCYLFSKDYIKRLLEIILDDTELSAIFCQITCQCSCNLLCPTMDILTFNETTLSFTLTNPNVSMIDPFTSYTITIPSMSPVLTTTVTGTFEGGTTSSTITLEGDFTSGTDYTVLITYEYTTNGVDYFGECGETISF